MIAKWKMPCLALLFVTLVTHGPAWTETPASQEKTPSENPSGNETDSDTLSPAELPEGTLGPVTLKATLSKTKVMPLTLEAALKLAEGQNVSLQIENKTTEKRQIEYRYRLSELMPDLTIGYNQSRFVGGVQIFGGELFHMSKTSYQPQLTANYTIYSAGANVFELKASKQRLEAQKSLSEDARQRILSEVALAYYNLQQAYWQRAISLQAIKEGELRVALSESRYKAGIGLKLDVLQAQTYLSQKKEQLLQVENRITKASDHLSQLLNLDFQVDLVPTSLDSTVARLVPSDSSALDLIALAKSTNPKLKALEQLNDAAHLDVKTTIANTFPRFDVTGYINGTGPSLDGLGLGRFAGLHVSLDLLENLGAAKPLKIKAAKSTAQLAQLNLVQAKSLLEESVANTLTDMKTLENKIPITKETLQYAKAAYSQALGRFQEGIGANVDLENTMTELTRVRSELATAFLDYNKAQVTLLSDLGLVSVNTLTQGYRPNGTHPH